MEQSGLTVKDLEPVIGRKNRRRNPGPQASELGA
jgi:hypothetical protein